VKFDPHDTDHSPAKPRARLVPGESKARGKRLPADPDGKVWIADETLDPPSDDIRNDADEDIRTPA